MKNRAKFIYLISPTRIKDDSFFEILNKLLKTKKVKFFQLRLKKTHTKTILKISKKVKKICKFNKVKFIINDKPIIAKKVMADGCHLGQSDMNLSEARKILDKIDTTGLEVEELLRQALKSLNK